MAIWQYHGFLIPQIAVRDGKQSLTGEPEDHAEFWRTSAVALLLRKEFTDLLPNYCAKTSFWSGRDDTDIRMELNGDFVESIFIRIDLRSVKKDWVQKLLDILKRHELVWVSWESSNVCVDREQFLADLRKSSAARFVKDPNGFFAES